MNNDKLPDRVLEEPLQKAKRLIGLKQSAYKDYCAARILFLNSELHQAALFANTCIEKELKSCLYTFGIDVNNNHNTFKLLNLLSLHDKETSDKINPEFLKILTKIYDSRYHEGLNPGYNFVIIKRKFLAELDYAYQVLERKVRFKSTRQAADVPKSLYEIGTSRKSDVIMHDNYLFANISKEAF